MCRGSFEHLAPDGATAGEKDVIEWQGNKRLCDASIPLFDTNNLRLEVLCNQTADQVCDRRCVFGWLQNRGVSGGKGADQGLKRQREGIVPGTNDQDAAQRFWDDIRSARTLCQGDRDAPGAHPSAKLALGQLEFLAQRNNFEEGFGWGFAQICRQGFNHLLFVLFNQLAEAQQLVSSPSISSGETSTHAVLHAAEFVDGQDQRINS
jgi:hypothetical protein